MFLTIFPALLSYGFGSYFLVPFLLRVTVAAFFAYQVIGHFTHKKAVADVLHNKFKWVSHEMAVWGVGVLILAELALGLFLFVGAFTQIAAILAALAFVKMAFFHKSMPAYAPLSRATYILLIIICVSLLFTGAGAFAFDLPL